MPNSPLTLRTLIAFVCLVGCGDDEDDGGQAEVCLEFDAQNCSPLYPPRYDRVFEETFVPRCSAPGTACHGNPEAIGARNGLIFADIDQTHMLLTADDSDFVVPGDASCSSVMIRLNTDDELLLMPPGTTKLSLEERCSVAQWIEQGAAR